MMLDMLDLFHEVQSIAPMFFKGSAWMLLIIAVAAFAATLYRWLKIKDKSDLLLDIGFSLITISTCTLAVLFSSGTALCLFGTVLLCAMWYLIYLKFINPKSKA